MNRALARALLAELIGTFTLVFAGCGAIMVNATTGALGHVGVAATFGLVIMAMIYAAGHVSGAHYNPAVTLGVFLRGRCPASDVLPYWGAQLLGAAAAAGIVGLVGDVAAISACTSAAPAGHACATLDFTVKMTGAAAGTADSGLIGTVWTLTDLVSAGGSTVSVVPGGVVATFSIGDDGTYQVDTGCNIGNGTATVGASSIDFGAMALTRRACTSDDAQLVETSMTMVIDGQVDYEIDEQSLRLTKGENGLVFAGS